MQDAQMQRKSLKSLLYCGAVILCAVLLKQFCYKKTDGFALYKILSSLPFCQEWECAPPSPATAEEIAHILDQPFYYLAKGAQSYVFASEDGKSVIKFFRLYHLRPPVWLTMVSLPAVLQPWKLGKMIAKQGELDKDFASYKIAFDAMQKETGLIYLHLNRTSHLKNRLTIYDKIGIAHSLDLDNMAFLVQRRAILVYPYIGRLMQTQGDTAAKGAISALLELLFHRCRMGIFDKDPDLNTNFGFQDDRPIQIDIGRFRRGQLADPAKNRDEILRITDNFRQWLDNNHPLLSSHLLSEIDRLQAEAP
jgi:hypothetical protein